MKMSPNRFFYQALALLILNSAIRNCTATDVDVFVSGQSGYRTYRIPALLSPTSGTLLAFCEGRKNGPGDAGSIALLLKRSIDAGLTWSKQQVVWQDGENTCGNPSPVFDRTSGRLWLFMTWNLGTDTESQIHHALSKDTRRVFLAHSDDLGLTWSQPDDITCSVKKPDWRWYATGPGHAIQTEDGTLVIPANHSRIQNGHDISSAHAILSTDHGRTWHFGGEAGSGTNESSVAELPDGRIYMNARSQPKINRRATAYSKNGGVSWYGLTYNQELVEPVCEGSVLRHKDAAGRVLYFFSNPAALQRRQMTVRTSFDNCATWDAGRLVYNGPSAYSDLCTVDSDHIALLYERNLGTEPYGRITFTTLPVMRK
jgi:sialidase-1